MNEDNPLKRSDTLRVKEIIFPGKEITCVVEGRTQGQFLIGFHDGYLTEVSLSGSPSNYRAFHAASGSEAINGIAVTSIDGAHYVAVSTRNEIKVYGFLSDDDRTCMLSYDFGSHGIYSTSRQGFVAPLGPYGFMVLRPDHGKTFTYSEFLSIDGVPYFYKFSNFNSFDSQNRELFAAAIRSKGVALLGIPEKGLPVVVKAATTQSLKMDFVSVCSIGNPLRPRSFVALGRDKSVHFFRDLLNSPDADMLTLSNLRGSAYKISAYRDHLLILTSQGLYVLRGAVADFHQGTDLGGLLEVRFFSMEASDFNILFDAWVSLVTSTGAAFIPVQSLVDDDRISSEARYSKLPPSISDRLMPSFPMAEAHAGSLEVSPIWKEVDYNPSSESMSCKLTLVH